ncbi:hydrogenase subunit MbhD domain-containing protein [Halomonas alkalicola]|uniref:hydrogenase subunit MbhD domain-containing protein n=1 Tax=Halomonas alkalicola TaxID=1930622 RepID=UPI00265E2CDB|nr:hydrogenase subunit MbhD domain-containing protein [Halomonas alkalicola]
MSGLVFGLDLMLVAGLAWLAWQALFGRHRFAAVVHFMAFGLVMALVWVRLDALDIALAEAAIGAGVTGALLLAALGRLPAAAGHAPAWRAAQRPLVLLSLATTLLVTLALAWVAWQLPRPGLAGPVSEVLSESGVENAVTAVLLNLRAWDTLLEIAVMLAAVCLVWSLGPALTPYAPATALPGLPALTRLLHPLFLLVPAYLLWRGSHAPGGAFPAGAVLGAGGVLLVLADAVPWMHEPRSQPLLRLQLAAGVLLFLAVGLVGLLVTGTFLAIPAGVAGQVILAVEVAAALSIALMLMAFYLFGEPAR